MTHIFSAITAYCLQKYKTQQSRECSGSFFHLYANVSVRKEPTSSEGSRLFLLPFILFSLSRFSSAVPEQHAKEG